MKTHFANGFEGKAADFTRTAAAPAAEDGREAASATSAANMLARFGDKGRSGARAQATAIKTEPGSPVTSPVDGTVVYAGEFRSYKNIAIIKGADGSYTTISGMQARAVSAGQTVKAGQVLGEASTWASVASKNPQGEVVDPGNLVAGLQAPASQVATGPTAMDGGALGIMGGGVPAPSEAARPSAPSPLSGGLGMGGMQGMGGPPAASAEADYADAGLGARGQIARALMGQAAAPKADPVNAGIVSMNDPEVAAAFAPNPKSYTSEPLGPLSGYVADGMVGDFARYAQGVPMSDPRAMMQRDNYIDGDLVGDIANSAAPNSESALTESVGDMSAMRAPTMNAQLGELQGMGSPPTALGFSTPLGPVTSADSFGFESEPSMAVSDVSPAAASAFGAYGSFGGIGAPDATQTALSYGPSDFLGAQPSDAVGEDAAPPAPTQKADVYAPGLRDFNNAFQGSVKSVGPKYSKAIAAALSTPSLANQLGVVNAAEAYSNMNGVPSRAVRGLRAQQIGDFAMANPALGDALGLSLGQRGQQGIPGGIGSDPFGGGAAPRAGPSFGAGGGFGGGPGQPSGPSFAGPSGPSAGRIGAGPPGGQPSGPSVSGPTGPAAGPAGTRSTAPGGGQPAGSNVSAAASAAAAAAAAGALGAGMSDPMGRFGGIF